ncbi:MAG: hypothetical protein LBJ43_06980 [Propionibacteriaceae bacterium]|nr:hypothetical protein [Propionibacteriaceae bacterium]
MAKALGHNLDFYFRNGYKLDGKFDLPYVRKQKIDLSDLKLIRFSSIVKDETEDTDATVHFFRIFDEGEEDILQYCDLDSIRHPGLEQEKVVNVAPQVNSWLYA